MLDIDLQNFHSLNLAEGGPQLTVYRASAGSGKTFTLATRFIELLIKKPTSYKEVLAVTFTVKATAEMKERILSQLYGLSHSLPDSESYLKQIMADLAKEQISFTEQEVRQRAGMALQLILHDYSNFNVETIDSFFQRILRNLARELELNANLRVELNDTDVEALAVDRLITELKGDDKVLGWIMSFIRQNMEEDKSWKVVDSIKEFGKKIFSHEYKEHSIDINEKMQVEEFFEKYQETLGKVMKAADEEMKATGKEFLNIIDGKYTIEDFYQKGRGPAGYFVHLSEGNYFSAPNSYVVAAIDSIEGWVGKDNKDNDKRKFVEDNLLSLLPTTEEKRKKCVRNYNSAKAALANLNELRLLNNIEQIVKDINSNANCFLLSDTQNVLHDMMQGSDTPFVFEKIGGRIRHIMIDEFQDTSNIQWKNFKKLLLDCMAHRGSQNLIVGDVKQSIYRWRNSDWSLLNNIENDSDFAGNKLEPIVLDKNFRSEKNIIDFNNAFFCVAPKQEKQYLEDDGNEKASVVEEIYSPDLTRQELPVEKKPQGLVDIRLLPAANVKEFSSKCIEVTQKYIEQLIAAGAQQKDIAILTRENKHIASLGNKLKERFSNYKFDSDDSIKETLSQCTFVSDDAFQLSSSVAVNIIVNAMKVLYNAQDLFSRTQLANDYNTYISEDTIELLLDRKHNKEDVNKLLPEEFVNKEEYLRSLPLNDMAGEISHIFGINKLSNESAYVNAFFDALTSFTQTYIPDLDNFVEYWDSVMSEKTVKGGDVEGIRLLTIHKAKGLEFDHVIVPFCDWELDKGSTLWVEPTEQPFSDMPVLPLDSKKLKETIFSDAYHEEKLQNTVDNLNLLYVTFTRAKKNLFIIGRNSLRESKQKGKYVDYTRRSGLLHKILPDVASELDGATFIGDTESKEGDLHFTYGSLYVKNVEKKETENIFLKGKETHCVDMTFSPHKVEFRQSNDSRKFVAASDDDAEKREYIKRGTICHNVLSHIYHLSDVDRVLGSFIEEGVLSDADPKLNKAAIAKLIRERVEDNKNPMVNEWFAEDVDVLDECTILSRNPQTGQVVKLRPDRVVCKGDQVAVIDFKFAKPKDEHHAQVKTYMNLLRDMGYDKVEGYLWYGYTNDIEEVK